MKAVALLAELRSLSGLALVHAEYMGLLEDALCSMAACVDGCWCMRQPVHGAQLTLLTLEDCPHRFLRRFVG